jgi:hypothetical protein
MRTCTQEQRLHSRCRTGGIEERQNETRSCDGLLRSAGTSAVAKWSPGRTDSPVDATCSRAGNDTGKISWRRHLTTDATQDTGCASGNTSLARKSAARQGKTNQETAAGKQNPGPRKVAAGPNYTGVLDKNPIKTRQDKAGRQESKQEKKTAGSKSEENMKWGSGMNEKWILLCAQGKTSVKICHLHSRQQQSSSGQWKSDLKNRAAKMESCGAQNQEKQCCLLAH